MMKTALKLVDFQKQGATKDGQPKTEINGYCLVCKEGFQYPYGRHTVEGELHSGTCSSVCEDIKDPASAEFRRNRAGDMTLVHESI